MDLLAYVTSFLESIQKNYLLYGGTLIGWYRDCGIIPFTTDIDLFLFSKEYDSRIKKHFVRNQNAILETVFGLPTDLYQLRVRDNKDAHTLDLFVGFPFNATHQATGYHIGRFAYS
jgi:hypothetical protein